MSEAVLLEIIGLRVELPGGSEPLLDDLSLYVGRGETVGLAGRSGAGKTTLALAALGLSRRSLKISGDRRFDGLNTDTPAGIARLRGKTAIILQDAASSLNPAFTVGAQLADAAAARGAGKEEARTASADHLKMVGIDIPAAGRLYPHQLSGGMRQRVLIAIALIGRPDLIIADEPVTALDPPLQADILALLRDYQEVSGCALLLISHDLDVIRGRAERVYIIDGGKIVEVGPVEDVFTNPRHRVTKLLVDADYDRPAANALANGSAPNA